MTPTRLAPLLVATAALTAAAQPDDASGYLFFVADCAKDGSHNFATSIEEFQQFEAEWLGCQ